MRFNNRQADYQFSHDVSGYNFWLWFLWLHIWFLSELQFSVCVGC